jgi:tRNA(Ile)-lysidine synthase
MAPATTVRRTDGGAWQLLRPLLDVARGDLRHHADTLQLPYVDDPSNDDPRFGRVRVRAALEHLSDLGITPEGLARTAHRMGRARVALAARAADIADRIQIAEPRITGHVLLYRDGFAPVERDTQLRLLAAALQLVTGAPYRPRAAALEALLDRIAGGGGGTLSGAQVHVGATTLRIAREYAAVAETSAPGDGAGVWDGLAMAGDCPGRCCGRLGRTAWAQLGALPDDAPPHGSRPVAARAVRRGAARGLPGPRPWCAGRDHPPAARSAPCGICSFALNSAVKSLHSVTTSTGCDIPAPSSKENTPWATHEISRSGSSCSC